jgi:hypothetical protein
VYHYGNWKLKRVFTATVPYGYFDFQGLVAEADVERVWFNPDLDRFRTEWVRFWGYGMAKPQPVQADADLTRPVVLRSDRPTTRFALVTGGTGAPPREADIALRMTETIRKHYAMGPEGGPWRAPAKRDNPLGFDLLAVTYGDDAESLAHVPSGEAVAFVARLLASPTGDPRR